ncbi:uncharacterized protein LOC131658904 [Vicia villosa]|uniref:uncharacterized protein LOC131658904 n=1 Tax=Vicia villosa TaxID=3911 RepID=UPI00273C428A|nr:uncharacterized protein LOC131658904 [Vicia villosa]
MVAGRNDDAIAEALRMLAGSIGQIPQANAAWLKAIEKIFRVMNCTDAQRVQFGTHMLEKEAEDWWNNTLQRFEEDGIEVTWDLFRDVFLVNYFPEDCRGKKEVEFLELKQGNGTVAVYAAKFQELIKYCPHYNTANAERSKSTNCRGGSNVTCFNCGEKGHVSTKCDKQKKEQAKGKVFALSGAGATSDERLIQETSSGVKLGMLKLTSGILDEIREGQKSDLSLVDRFILIN